MKKIFSSRCWNNWLYSIMPPLFDGLCVLGILHRTFTFVNWSLLWSSPVRPMFGFCTPRLWQLFITYRCTKRCATFCCLADFSWTLPWWERSKVWHDAVLSIGLDKYAFPNGHTSRAVFLLVYFLHVSSFPSTPVPCIVIWLSSVVASPVLLDRHVRWKTSLYRTAVLAIMPLLTVSVDRVIVRYLWCPLNESCPVSLVQVFICSACDSHVISSITTSALSWVRIKSKTSSAIDAFVGVARRIESRHSCLIR